MVNPLGSRLESRRRAYATIDQAYQGELRTTAETIRNYQLKYYYTGAGSPSTTVGWRWQRDCTRAAAGKSVREPGPHLGHDLTTTRGA